MQTSTCVYICVCMQKGNYKLDAHWPQRLPKRVPSRRSGRRQKTTQEALEILPNVSPPAATALCFAIGASGACVCVSLPLQMAAAATSRQTTKHAKKMPHTHTLIQCQNLAYHTDTRTHTYIYRAQHARTPCTVLFMLYSNALFTLLGWRFCSALLCSVRLSLG